MSKQRVCLLANDYTVVAESPDPENIYLASPGVLRLDDGRLIATTDYRGPGVRELPEYQEILPLIEKYGFKTRMPLFGSVMVSDDRGKTWREKAGLAFFHSRPFAAGDSIYIIGHMGDLVIHRSRDRGETWEGPFPLTKEEEWHQAPCNVHYANGRVYLVMERTTDPDVRRVQKLWPVSVCAPVLMSAKVDDDLTNREAWTFADELTVRDDVGEPDLIGVPFYETGNTVPRGHQPGRHMAPIGWLETNVVQFTDPDHIWHDPEGRTFHLLMRAHTGMTGYACILKVTEAEDGSLHTGFETAPSGKKIVYIPFPGGQMKFHILFDQTTQLYWMLSTMAIDSMTRPECLPGNRYNLPNNERRILALHFSRNCMDWCMAGIVARGDEENHSRHYASMAIDGDDLVVLSRSSDARALPSDPARRCHDGNVITCHVVENFRDLVYI